MKINLDGGKMGISIIPINIFTIIFIPLWLVISGICYLLDEKFNILPNRNEDSRINIHLLIGAILSICITIKILFN